MKNNNARNIGLFAHVDAGKTTLSESLLLTSGAIRKAGSVNDGSAHTDRMEVERRRGISVKAACAKMTWEGVEIRLIDTPGHVDFASEVERSLWAIDGAVLIVSGVDGVEPQTEALFTTLARMRIPTILFVNKMDRETADFSRVFEQIKQALSPGAVDFEDDDSLMAAVAETDEAALADYVSGVLYPRAQLRARAAALIQDLRMLPVLAGSALTGQGVAELLDAILYLPAPERDASQPPLGVVFAVEADASMGRGAYVRMFAGALKNRDTVAMKRKIEQEYASAEREDTPKITQIRVLTVDGRGQDAGAMAAGDIGVIYGLGDVRTGQVIGEEARLPRKIRPGEMRAPLLMVKIEPEKAEDRQRLLSALSELSAEDPLLNVRVYGSAIHINAMGLIQLEILSEQLKARYGLPVSFGKAETMYRETISRPAVGFVAYTMPKPCWAVIRFELEPNPRGRGVTYESIVPYRDIQQRYQHQIEQALPTALSQGMFGWPVDDIHIRLTGGEDHLIHTHPLDFIVATPMALMDGLQRGGSALLEPILSIEITSPKPLAGRVAGLLQTRRGRVLENRVKGELIQMICEAPAATSMDLSVELSRVTSGKGAMSVSLKGYRECELSAGAVCPRRGVNPLDTAKYILAARNALDGNIFL